MVVVVVVFYLVFFYLFWCVERCFVSGVRAKGKTTQQWSSKGRVIGILQRSVFITGLIRSLTTRRSRMFSPPFSFTMHRFSSVSLSGNCSY
ncbi:hypothetical protein QBC41DRAFT_322243 [Cercophora samala]|uniref:Uncharacterized protein n=1 Tax=Cercophora samala TaxID=330535 RepID=A0AA40DBU5_9PEZI|nr:hypothetical protein QBC41DRAFT_322243 [Cercophora samala]